MAANIASSRRPSAWLARAEACLITPSAHRNRRGKRCPEIGKFSTARAVVAPYSASSGTWTSPIESCTVRIGSPSSHAPGGRIPYHLVDLELEPDGQAVLE